MIHHWKCRFVPNTCRLNTLPNTLVSLVAWSFFRILTKCLWAGTRIAVEEKGPDRIIRHDKDDTIGIFGILWTVSGKTVTLKLPIFWDQESLQNSSTSRSSKGRKDGRGEQPHLDKQSRVDPILCCWQCVDISEIVNIHRTTVFGTEWRAIRPET